MAKRYEHGESNLGSGDDCPYSWLSEWLCEYVDGSMDPSVRAVFDEYLEANPDLAEHVERLCRTRTLLSECRCQQEAAKRVQQRVRQEHLRREAEQLVMQEGEAEGEEAPVDDSIRPLQAGTVVALASAMTLMLGVGMVAGAVLFTPPSPPTPAVESTAERTPVADRPARPSATTRASTPAVGTNLPTRFDALARFSLLEEASAPSSRGILLLQDHLESGDTLGQHALLQPAGMRP